MAKIIDDIKKLIRLYRLAEAMEALRAADQKRAVTADVRQTEENYGYLLRYFQQSAGQQDPGRNAEIRRLAEQLRVLADRLDISLREPSDDSRYFTLRRNHRFRVQNASLQDQLSELVRQAAKLDTIRESGQYSRPHREAWERATDDLFSSLWIAFPLTGDQSRELSRFLLTQGSSTLREAQALAVSALLLGSLRYFDRRALSLLLKVANASDDAMVAARALTAATLLSRAWSQRFTDDKELSDLFAAILDKKALAAPRRTLLAAFARTVASERAGQHVKENIMPTISEMKPLFDKLKKEDITTRDADGEPELNPAWDEALQNSGLSKRIEELSEMQSDGLDVMMSAFSGMKQFPFFVTLSHWFLPFTSEHTSAHDVCTKLPPNVVDLLQGASGFCASDLYSMASMMQAMPNMKMAEMFTTMSDQVKDMEQAEANTRVKPQIEKEISLYLRDLYRFFRFGCDEEPDPFSTPLSADATPLFSDLRADTDLRATLAEFFLKYGYWEQAIAEFKGSSASADDAGLYNFQKIGYCHEQLGQHRQALEYYKKAELVDSSSPWLLRRMAGIALRQADYDDAIGYLNRALALKPESTAIMMQLGRALSQAREWEQAAEIFHKVRYLKPKNQNATRMAAWCEFSLGNYSKALSLYSALTEQTAADQLNTAHALLGTGDVAGAVQSYGRAYRISGAKDFAAFRDTVMQDLLDIQLAGLSADDLRLALELTYLDNK